MRVGKRTLFQVVIIPPIYERLWLVEGSRTLVRLISSAPFRVVIAAGSARNPHSACIAMQRE
jgi:hypothetical protein